MQFIIQKLLYKYWLLFLALDGSQKELTKELGLKMVQMHKKQTDGQNAIQQCYSANGA